MSASQKDKHSKFPITIVIHGGAGNINHNEIHPDQMKLYNHALNAALNIGYKILEEDGSAVDAVEAAVTYLEDCGLFNAGKGSVLNEYNMVETDASIMDGNSGKAGAVAGMHLIKNPVKAARFVMDSTTHVLFTGTEAEKFLIKEGIDCIDKKYYQRVNKDNEKINKEKKGTVGAVAIDIRGNLAAATSTGGMSGKKAGRVGDSPIIGAGTFANKIVAVSCTGHGEYFIRNVAAYDLASIMEYKNASIRNAADEVISKIGNKGGTGGLIAIDKSGEVALVFNTTGMFRAVKSEKECYVKVGN